MAEQAKKRAKKSAKAAEQQAAPAVAQSAPAPLASIKQAPTRKLHRRQLKNADYNPKLIDAAARRKLRKSLERFGLVETPVWNERTGNIVGGHQRISQLDEIAGTDDYELVVTVVSIDDKTERELNVALNNPALQGYYDVEALDELIRSGIDSFDPSIAGFDPIDLEHLYDAAGISTDTLDALYSPTGKQEVNDAADEIDRLMDDSDEIRKEQKNQTGNGDGRSNADPGTAASDRTVAGDISQGKRLTPAEQAAESNLIESFKAAREKFNSRVAQENERAFFVVLCFRTDQEKQVFLERLNIDPHEQYVDGPMFAEICGINLSNDKADSSENAAEHAAESESPQ